jgi:hypothetical protein
MKGAVMLPFREGAWSGGGDCACTNMDGDVLQIDGVWVALGLLLTAGRHGMASKLDGRATSRSSRPMFFLALSLKVECCGRK